MGMLWHHGVNGELVCGPESIRRKIDAVLFSSHLWETFHERKAGQCRRKTVCKVKHR